MTVEVHGRGIYFEGVRVAVLTGDGWPTLVDSFIKTIEDAVTEDDVAEAACDGQCAMVSDTEVTRENTILRKQLQKFRTDHD